MIALTNLYLNLAVDVSPLTALVVMTPVYHSSAQKIIGVQKIYYFQNSASLYFSFQWC